MLSVCNNSNSKVMSNIGIFGYSFGVVMNVMYKNVYIEN